MSNKTLVMMLALTLGLASCGQHAEEAMTETTTEEVAIEATTEVATEEVAVETMTEEVVEEASEEVIISEEN